MRFQLKKTAALLFLLAGFSPFLLFFYVSWKVQDIRHRMKEEMEEQRLTDILLPSPGPRWIKPGKEILVNGKMFDVHSFVKEGNTIRFRGLFDEEETRLNLLFRQSMHKNNQDQQQWLAQLFQVLSGIDPGPAPERFNPGSHPQYRITVASSPLHKMYFRVPTPPPQA